MRDLVSLVVLMLKEYLKYYSIYRIATIIGSLSKVKLLETYMNRFKQINETFVHVKHNVRI